MENILKIGDKVMWKGSWGAEDSKEVRIKEIEVNCVGKDGSPVNSVEWSEVCDRSVIVVLDNGHWAYGFQITPLPELQS